MPLSPLERHIYEGEQGKLLRAFERLGGSSARDEGASKQVGGGKLLRGWASCLLTLYGPGRAR